MSRIAGAYLLDGRTLDATVLHGMVDALDEGVEVLRAGGMRSAVVSKNQGYLTKVQLTESLKLLGADSGNVTHVLRFSSTH